MRNFFYLLLAVCTALTVTAGVADARGGGHGGGHSISCTPASGASTCNPSLPNGHQLPTCTVATGATTCSDSVGGFNHGPGGNFGGGFGNGFGDRRGPGGPHGIWPYPGLPGGFPQLLNGNLLSLQALGLVGVNANIDVCGYSTFQDFDAYAGPRYGGGWGMARNRWFGGNQANSEWLALRQAAACSSGMIVPGMNGFNGLLNGSYLNLSQYGINGLSTVNVCSYPSWDAFSGYLQPRFGGRWGGFQGRFGGNRGMWRNNFNQLRMQASCGVAMAPISQPVYPAPAVDPAPVVSAPTTTVEAAPSTSSDNAAPPTSPSPPSGSTIVEIPSGPISTGDAGLAPDAVLVN